MKGLKLTPGFGACARMSLGLKLLFGTARRPTICALPATALCIGSLARFSLAGFRLAWETKPDVVPFLRSVVLPGFRAPFCTRLGFGPFLSSAVLPGLSALFCVNVGPFLRILGSTFAILKRGLSLTTDRRNDVVGLAILVTGLANVLVLGRENERAIDARGAETDMLRP